MNASLVSEAERCESEWKSISVGDGKYLIRATDRDGSWKISLTNLIEIWTEELDRDKILQKCEKLNPNLSTEDIDVHQFVCQIFKDMPKHAAKVSVEQIKLSSELEGGIFEFAIDLTRGSAQQLWEEVTMPLCLAAEELRRRQTILLDLIKKKDAEISEYKLNDAKLTREHIRTEAFDDDLFKKNVSTQIAGSYQNVFQRMMELRQDIRMERFSAKSETTKTCSTEALNSRGSSVKIEGEENSRARNIDLVTDNGAPSNIEDKFKTETAIKESNSRVPKTESKSPPESPKPSKSVIENANRKIDIPKRTRSAPALPAKRTRKSIHDFIK